MPRERSGEPAWRPSLTPDTVESTQRSALFLWATTIGVACLGIAVFHLLRGRVGTGIVMVALGTMSVAFALLRSRISTRWAADVLVVAIALLVYGLTLYTASIGSRGGITAVSLIMLVPLMMVISALSAQRTYQWAVVAIGGAVSMVVWLEVFDLPATRDAVSLFRLVAYPAWAVMAPLSYLILRSVRGVRELTRDLHSSERRARGIFDSAVDAHVVHRFDGTIVDVNHAACDTYGYTRSELLGRSIGLLEVSEDDRMENLHRLRIDEVSEHRIETMHRRVDGTTFPVEVRVRTVDINGELHCIAVIRDVSERRERERRIAFQAQVLDTVSGAVLVVDPNGMIVYGNQSAADLAGRGVGDLLGTDARSAFLNASNRKVGVELVDTALDNRVWFGELTLVRADGREMPTLVTATPIRDDRGRVEHVILLAVDISEQKALERQLRDATLAAERAARAKSAFLASMSHEIRTPLNGIIGFADVLLEQNPRVDQLEALTHLKSAGQTLLTILNDVLDISKLESGRYELHPVDFDVLELLSSIEALYGHNARDKGLSLTVEADPGLPRYLTGDPDRLRQLLGNLVSNGIKYTEEGGISVHLGVYAEDETSVTLRVEVADTGVGIRDEDIPKLFTLFERLHRSGAPRTPGTGLGLAICQRLVESMEGEISVQSVVGEGSTFTCTVRVTRSDVRRSPAAERRRVSAEDDRPFSVLVADDDRVSSTVAARLLQSAGHSVDVVSDGAAAVEAAARGSYDLIFMDLQMPELDGLEATSSIRASTPDSPVIVGLSASAMEDDRAAMLAAGMDLVIAKPVTKSLLLEAIEEARTVQRGTGERA